MPKASVYEQLNAAQVKPGPFMPPSPRHWNPGMIRYKGRLWMSMRYHLGKEHGSRCATGMVPLDKKTFVPTALYQHLNLPAVIGDEHFEDARLFMFKGEPHISYTQMTGYRPGIDYACTIKYARLRLLGNRWLIEEVFFPKFGRNSGYSKEKNWVFFEHDGKLHCIYQDHPTHKVICLDGDKVTAEYDSDAAKWPWGQIRGGATPVPYGEGKMMHVFHSSLPTEVAPHYVRYYAGAYIFELKPPFRITEITVKPIVSGSEADGHGHDPRYSDGWKPFIPFPCGCVPDGDDFLVSMGVNDWQCAVGRVTSKHLQFVAPDGSASPSRYFMTPNGSLPVRFVTPEGVSRWIPWQIPISDRRGAMAAPGYYMTSDPREAETIEEVPRTQEITCDQYQMAIKKSA